MAAAINARLRELHMTTAELAEKSGQPSAGTPRYFVFLTHDRRTLRNLSAALGWPPGRIEDLFTRPELAYIVTRGEDGVWCARADLRPGVGVVGDGATRQEAVGNLRIALHALRGA
jgi:hypothetical protein